MFEKIEIKQDENNIKEQIKKEDDLSLLSSKKDEEEIIIDAYY
jgi:beta-galactosidase beta subunit